MKLPSNTPPPPNPSELWKHLSDTYFSLRLALALLAFAMPFVLYLYGKIRHGVDLQPSMSAYFWAATGDQCASFPMRTIFVGFLFAIGIGLYAYKGLTPLENYLLNAAALCAAVVAIYPTTLSEDKQLTQFLRCPAVQAWAAEDRLPIHFIAACAVFVLLAMVAWFCASKSLKYLPPGHDPAKFRRIYKGIAIAMILFPIPGVAIAFLLGILSHRVFFIEAAGILTFGVYWLVKSRELALSCLEKDPAEAVQHAAQRQMLGPPPQERTPS